MPDWTEGLTRVGKLCRIFDGEKYRLNIDGRYFRTSKTNRTLLSHAIWDYYHPEDIVVEGEVVHHINGVIDDDRVENYTKLGKGQHCSYHKKEVARDAKGRFICGRISG